jgi:hypothetical protein
LGLQPGERFVMLTDGKPERSAGTVDLRGLVVSTRTLHHLADASAAT